MTAIISARASRFSQDVFADAVHTRCTEAVAARYASEVRAHKNTKTYHRRSRPRNQRNQAAVAAAHSPTASPHPPPPPHPLRLPLQRRRARSMRQGFGTPRANLVLMRICLGSGLGLEGGIKIVRVIIIINIIITRINRSNNNISI
jgi:hypothetical protein